MHIGLSHVTTHIQIYQLPFWGHGKSASVSWPVGSQSFKKRERVERQQEGVIIGWHKKDNRKICKLAGSVGWFKDSGQKPGKHLVVTYFQSVTM